MYFMNVDYAIDIGHNCYPDIGAVGILKEDTVVKEVGTKVMIYLKQLGYNIVDCLPPHANDVNSSLYYRYTVANRDEVKLYVSIHANIGGGKGTEIWCGSESSREIANRILEQFSSLGYYNRGVKIQGVNGQHIAVLKNTTMPAILIELFFLDNKEDCERYNPELMARAIVKGLTGKNVQPVPVVQNVAKYDTSVPTGANILTLPGGNHYIESLPDRLIVHMDRGNYIDIRKGSIFGFVNDNNGHSKSGQLL
jgi:hypothetical protein